MGNWNWESIQGYIPIIIIVLIGIPLAYLGGRKPKCKPGNEEKNKQNT